MKRIRALIGLAAALAMAGFANPAQAGGKTSSTSTS
jgi:hypothetical protein